MPISVSFGNLHQGKNMPHNSDSPDDAQVRSSKDNTATELQILLSQNVQALSANDVERSPGMPVLELAAGRDRFSLNARFENTAGVAPENRGQGIDTSQKRPIHILSPKEAANLGLRPAAPGETLVSNFVANGKFYIARFPANGVSEVFAQKEYFDPGFPVGNQLNKMFGFSAHLQTRFEFNKPGKEVVLVPQDDPTNTSRTIKLHNILASGESIPAKGKSGFNPLKGLSGHYAYALRMVSMKDKYDERVTQQHHTIKQYRIKPVVNENVLIGGKHETPDMVRQTYLKSALQLSNNDYNSFKAGHPVMYNTLERSCVTGGLAIFDQANQSNNPAHKNVHLHKRNPMLIRHMLGTRGMLYQDDHSPGHGTPDLKTDVESNKHFRW
jgi:hypothetical protein